MTRMVGTAAGDTAFQAQRSGLQPFSALTKEGHPMTGSVLASNWDALGYARIFDRAAVQSPPAGIGAATATSPRNDKASAEGLAGRFKERGYHTYIDSENVWIRDPGKVKDGGLPAPYTAPTWLDAASYRDPANYEEVRLNAASDYGTYSATENGARELQSRINVFRDAPTTAHGAYNLAVATILHRAAGFEDFLRDWIAKAFFGSFPKGRIGIIRMPYIYERRQGAVRGAYVTAQYGLAALNDEISLGAMGKWSTLAPSETLRVGLDLATSAMYPAISFFHTFRPGLALIFVPGEQIDQVFPDFPTDWLALFGSRTDFSQGMNRASAKSGAGSSHPIAVHRRFLQEPQVTTHEVCAWVDWIVGRCGEHVRWSTDPTSHLSPDGIVDFVTAFEHALTVDRLLRKAVTANVATQSALRKGATFEVVDILEELTRLWRDPHEDFFKPMFNPASGPARFRQAFADAPQPWRDLLIDGADAVYAGLRSTVEQSIIVPDKKTLTGVMVRNRQLNAENPESFDDFTANVVRALRNTHHGYLTRRDTTGARPSRYLGLVTGALPDSFTYIGVLAGLAYLADPRGLVGRLAYPLEHYESLV